MKNLIILVLLMSFSFLFADTARDEVHAKIEYALKCNARFTNISDVRITTLEESSQFPGSYYVAGVYKSVSAVSGNKFGFAFGDEFHPASGSFNCIVDENLQLKKMKWKVGVARGHIKKSCLGAIQERF